MRGEGEICAFPKHAVHYGLPLETVAGALLFKRALVSKGKHFRTLRAEIDFIEPFGKGDRCKVIGVGEGGRKASLPQRFCIPLKRNVRAESTIADQRSLASGSKAVYCGRKASSTVPTRAVAVLLPMISSAMPFSAYRACIPRRGKGRSRCPHPVQWLRIHAGPRAWGGCLYVLQLYG